MKKKLLFVLFAVLTLAVGATAATSSVIERTGKSIKKERTAPPDFVNVSPKIRR